MPRLSRDPKWQCETKSPCCWQPRRTRACHSGTIAVPYSGYIAAVYNYSTILSKALSGILKVYYKTLANTTSKGRYYLVLGHYKDCAASTYQYAASEARRSAPLHQD